VSSKKRNLFGKFKEIENGGVRTDIYDFKKERKMMEILSHSLNPKTLL